VSIAYSVLVLTLVVSLPQFSLLDIRGVKLGLSEFVPGWPQRFSVLLMAGFFFCFCKGFHQKLYFVSASIIFASLCLTFTRAIYLSLLCGFIYLVSYYLFNHRLDTRGKLFSLVAAGIITLGLGVFISHTDSLIVEAALSIFVEALNSAGQFISGDLSGERWGGSDGARVHHWQETIQLWSLNPIFGTGFVGIYQYGDLGSTHSQYLDILMRAGLIGLLGYALLWVLLFKHFWRVPEVCAGLIAVFAFGFIHETTKLSYVGLMFALLLCQVFKESSSADTSNKHPVR
jgi:O-antigen ligase